MNKVQFTGAFLTKYVYMSEKHIRAERTEWIFKLPDTKLLKLVFIYCNIILPLQ